MLSSLLVGLSLWLLRACGSGGSSHFDLRLVGVRLGGSVASMWSFRCVGYSPGFEFQDVALGLSEKVGQIVSPAGVESVCGG